MSNADRVDRQLKERQSYNLFYSALTSRASPCLTDRGWRAPIIFGKLEDPYANVTSEPDFVLYNGDICLLVEIKSGNNIQPRHISQMQRCNELTIDGIEREFTAADVSEKTPYDGTVQIIDRCIVYHDIDEEWLERCRNEWTNCQEQLENLERETAILTQDFGGRLRRIAGEFRSNSLQRLFDQGIELPENPKQEFALTEQMEKESLAIAICEIWGEQAIGYEDPVEVNINQIRDHFAPRYNVSPEKVNRVLYYLHEIDACDHRENLTYEFSQDRISEILQITQTVRERDLDSALEEVNEKIPDEKQTTLDLTPVTSEEGVANGGDERESEDG